MQNDIIQTETNFTLEQYNIVIIAANYYQNIVNKLITGAQQVLLDHKISQDNLHTILVPGAYELPLASQQYIQSIPQVDGIIALGAVIRGETSHFDYICANCAQGIMQVSLKYNKPIAFGVLTTNDLAQAMARITDTNNKGKESALALIQMLKLKDVLREK